MGVFTALGTLALLVVLAVLSGAYAIFFGDVPNFFSGVVDTYAAHTAAPLLMLAVIAAVVSIKLPLSYGSDLLVIRAIGKPKGGHELNWLFEKFPQKHAFRTFFFAVFVEELFTRWLFLGAIPWLFGLNGPVSFYILFILGNVGWSLIHLFNYKEKEDRNPLRVLPQLVAGVFFTYIYMKYGLMASVLAHFASNAILFSTSKQQNFDWADVARIVVLALTAVISYALMNHSITEIAPWFQRTPEFALAGWGFWDYLLADIFLGAVFSLVVDLLLYDKSDAHDSDHDDTTLWAKMLMLPLVAIIAVAFYYAGFWLLGLVISSVLIRTLLLAILFAMLFSKQNSASAIAGRFWLTITSGYITVCVLQALDFWPAMACVLLGFLVHIPLLFIHQFDD